jgi:hypothetical protein
MHAPAPPCLCMQRASILLPVKMQGYYIILPVHAGAGFLSIAGSCMQVQGSYLLPVHACRCRVIYHCRFMHAGAGLLWPLRRVRVPLPLPTPTLLRLYYSILREGPVHACRGLPPAYPLPPTIKGKGACREGSIPYPLHTPYPLLLKGREGLLHGACRCRASMAPTPTPTI